MSAEELPLTPPATQPEQDADTRPVAVTLASVTRDGRRAILVDEQGREFTLELDQRLRPTPQEQPRRRTEVPMESALRPRDIQARIRAGESPEEVAEAARISPSQGGVRVGRSEALEQITWADPGLFSVLPLPVVAGDLKTALSTPDAVVLTRGMARKYFGQDAPLGRTLEINPALSNLPGLS